MTTINDFIKATDKYANNSKVWLHFFEQPFSAVEEELAIRDINSFSNNWFAHGKKLQNSIVLIHSQILICTVNSEINQPTGCSIDAQYHWVLDLSNKYKKNLAPRNKIFYLENNELAYIDFNNIDQLWAKKDSVFVANLFYNQLSDVRNSFWVKIEDSHFRNLIRTDKI